MNPSVNCSFGKTGNGTNLMNIALKKVAVFIHRQDVITTRQHGQGKAAPHIKLPAVP